MEEGKEKEKERKRKHRLRGKPASVKTGRAGV